MKWGIMQCSIKMKQALKQTLRAASSEGGKVTGSFVFTCDWLRLARDI